MLKDIIIEKEKTHSGHLRILQKMAIERSGKEAVNSFDALYKYWQTVFDVSILNKQFYQELANWYFWAIKEVEFPDDVEKNEETRNAISTIRLITRLIFIWFIKERNLVPSELFDEKALKNVLKGFDPQGKEKGVYYNAILQNLFFGTLNQSMDKRKFAEDGTYHENRKHYGVKNVFRYSNLFSIPEKEALKLFSTVPFLNGGLFDCLDKEDEKGKVQYVDGFSRDKKKRALVPDYLFFGKERQVNLSNEYNNPKKKKEPVEGLINLLNSYKFTVAENTPLEEEVALDPELLGKVFENLLASYNPETRTTARKQTGSFYTPREIVNYMVDESLIVYLLNDLPGVKDADKKLRQLFSYTEKENLFQPDEVVQLVSAIDNCKILDPACGSGAFPMGILHKLVHILGKLDEKNKLWKQVQKQKAIQETENAYNLGDKEERRQRLLDIEETFELNSSNYGRKLYLIENCIYGVDIQPIACQIAKLRFFISLVIDQQIHKDKDNYGIRPLPNLETKFVAANTLIGLDKLKEGDQLMFENEVLKKAENQLMEVRHRYFNAKTRTQKTRCQEQDKKLRETIAALLVGDGWDNITATQIAQWNPYDQNASALFFDREWMFGNKEGFDVVIGNPPYISYYSNTGARLSAEEKSYFANNYSSIIKTNDRINSMNLFTERGLLLLKKGGTLSYITNKTISVLPSYIEIRRFVLDNAKIEYIVTNLDPFEAIVDCVVFGLQRETIEEHNTEYKLKWLVGGIDEFETIDISLFIANPNLEFHYSPYQTILAKIERYPGVLNDIITINRGVNIGGCFDHFLSPTKINDDYERFLSGTRSVYKYGYQWVEANDGFFKFDTDKERELRDLGETLVLGNHDRYLVPRLFIPESGQTLMSAYSSERIYSAYGIMVGTAKKKKDDLKFVCALLNSKLITFYAIEKEILRKGNKATPHVGVKGLKRIPLPAIDEDDKKKFIELVDKVTSIKKKSNSPESKSLEYEIDLLVYKLYGLSYEEVKVIDPNIEAIISEKDYNKRPAIDALPPERLESDNGSGIKKSKKNEKSEAVTGLFDEGTLFEKKKDK